MHRLLNDLRFGLRMLAKTPSATVMVLVALSLGIGLSVLMFSLINGAVLAKLPGDGADRIMRVERAEALAQTFDDYPTWASRNRTFDGFGAVEMTTVTLAIEGSSPEPVMGAAITPSILRLLSVQPILGRPFVEEDAAPGAPPVVLLSHNVWRNHLGSDRGALGWTVRVNGRVAEIVGVMPEGFGFPWDHDVWSPLFVDLTRGGSSTFTTLPETRWVVGRLREDVSAEAAERELTAITRELDNQIHGADGSQSAVHVRSYTDIFSERGRSAALAALMLGIAFLVLLVACSNVANVLLARAVARRREIATRLALGASRLRVTTQLMTETSLLAAAGAVGGVVVAVISTRQIEAGISSGMPYWIAFRVDWPVLGFVAIVAVLSALMAGLMPAVQAGRSNTHEILKEDGRGSSSFRLGRVMRRLVGVEIALSFVLLVLAGLFIRSAANFNATDFAFAPDEVYTARVSLPLTEYDDVGARVRFVDALRETLGGLPQVAGVALATAVPGVGSSERVPVQVEGVALDASLGTRTRAIVVTPGYFALCRASLVAGRDFDTRDRAGSIPVAIVNESFARKHFPDGALDRRIRYSGPQGPQAWLTIVGVTPDLLEGGVERQTPEAVYVPLAQNPSSTFTIIARPRVAFAALPGPIRESIAALNPDVALSYVLPLDEVIADANSSWKWMSILFLICGAIALFLAALGLYGVIAFWVMQRTREIGVRMALGGQRGDIVRLVLRQGMTQTWLGLAAGVVLAVPAALTLGSALYGVAPYDPMVFGGVLAVLVVAAWLGCWMPARRATRVHPLKALAAE